MKKILFLFIAVAFSLKLNAQVLQQMSAQDTLPKIMAPLGEIQDTVYVLAVLLQEKEPLKAERFMVISRIYVFSETKYNSVFDQWVEKIPSALTPKVNSKKISKSEFQNDLVKLKILPKPK